MKLYRVVTDIMTTNHGEDFFEYIYYLGGYAFFYNSGECWNDVSNTAKYKKDKNAKYFFVFPEDAVRYRDKFAFSDTGHILEYEFSDDKLPKLFGMGDYTPDYGPLLNSYGVPQNCHCALEVLVQSSELTGQKTYSKLISSEEKDDMIYKMYVNTQNLIYDFQKEKNRDELKTKEELLSLVKKGSFFYKPFHSGSNYLLIKSNEITGKTYGFINYSEKKDNVKRYAKCFNDYMKESGLLLDYSEQAEKDRDMIKEECGYCVGSDPEKYFEKVRTMVSDYNHKYNR